MIPKSSSLWVAGVILVGASAAGMTHLTQRHHLIPSAPSLKKAAVPAAPSFIKLRISTIGRLPVAKEGIALTANGNTVESVGGYTGTYSTSSVFEVVPRVRQTATLPQPTHDSAAGFIHQHLYIFGGGQATSYTTVLRVTGSSVSQLPSLPSPLSDAVAVPLRVNGQSGLVLLGGYDGSVFNQTANFYTENAAGHLQSRPLFQLETGVRYAAVASDRQSVWIAGGLTSANVPTAAVYAWSKKTGLKRVGTLPVALQKAAAFTWRGQLIVAGGYNANNQAQRSVWDLNLRTHQTKRIANLPIPLADMGYTQVGNTGYLLGGSTGNTVEGNLYSLNLLSD